MIRDFICMVIPLSESYYADEQSYYANEQLSSPVARKRELLKL